jgi:hypothetical protein
MSMMYGGDDEGMDMTFDDLAMYLETEFQLNLTDDAWNAFEMVDSEPGTPEFEQQTGDFCNWLNADYDTCNAIIEGISAMMMEDDDTAGDSTSGGSTTDDNM